MLRLFSRRKLRHAEALGALNDDQFAICILQFDLYARHCLAQLRRRRPGERRAPRACHSPCRLFSVPYPLFPCPHLPLLLAVRRRVALAAIIKVVRLRWRQFDEFRASSVSCDHTLNGAILSGLSGRVVEIQARAWRFSATKLRAPPPRGFREWPAKAFAKRSVGPPRWS